MPLVLYGPGFVRSAGSIELDREVTIADLAPTYAEVRQFEEWPDRKESEALSEVLEVTEETPKLIFTAVIDGGGWNVFDHWSDRHPNLSAIIERGAGVEDAIVGSSPSITPATHTNVATGVFPRAHGVTAIAVRDERGQIVGSFSEEAGNPGTASSTRRSPCAGPRSPIFGIARSDSAPKSECLRRGTSCLGWSATAPR